MAVTLTFHNDQARTASVVGGQIGDAIEVTDGAVSASFAISGLYRIVATSDCIVRIGNGLEDADGGETWLAGMMEVRFIRAGEACACDAMEE